jgi:hypothetical protein
LLLLDLPQDRRWGRLREHVAIYQARLLDDKTFDEYPDESIAAWHQRLGLKSDQPEQRTLFANRALLSRTMFGPTDSGEPAPFTAPINRGDR